VLIGSDACLLPVKLIENLRAHGHSAFALRSLNLAGFPLIPKSLWPAAPYSRHAFNSFLVWIHQLGLKSASTILDVGANHGDFARAASTLFPAARVFLFEPLPDLQTYLARVVARLRLPWTVVPEALGSQRGSFPMFIDESDDAIGSFTGFTDDYLKANPKARPTREITCEVRSLDEVMRERGLNRIDLMKIDVEGFEFEVLKGAASGLRRTRAVVIEVSLVRRQTTNGHPLLEMLGLLSGAGFDVVDVIPSLFAPEAPWKPTEFNVLARRAEDAQA